MTDEPPEWDKWRREGLWGKSAATKRKATSSGGKGKPKPKGIYPLPHPGPDATPTQLKRHTFAVNLCAVREDKLLSQADLARLTGINPDTISSWHQETRSPTMANLKLLAEKLEISPKQLYKPLKEDMADKTIPTTVEGPDKVQMILHVSPETAVAISRLVKKARK